MVGGKLCRAGCDEEDLMQGQRVRDFEEGVPENYISLKVDALSKVIRDDITYGCMAWQYNYKNA